MLHVLVQSLKVFVNKILEQQATYIKLAALRQVEGRLSHRQSRHSCGTIFRAATP